MNLLRNCPHNNGIYTFFDLNSKIIKSSYSEKGINSLSREYRGYKWYLDRIKCNRSSTLCLYKRQSGTYARLFIPFFNGGSVNYYDDISCNFSYLLKAIEVYIDIWPTNKSNKTYMHGDYSLGNLIFDPLSKEMPLIIDWEHFRERSMPWGFDLVNLLYESVFFSFKGGDVLTKNNIHSYIKLKKYLLSLLDSKECMECNINELSNVIVSNMEFWDDVFKKLPVLKFTKQQKDFICKIDSNFII